MVATTRNSLTIRTGLTGNQPAASGDRFGLGLVANVPPADFLSQGHFSLPRLPDADQKVRPWKDKGEPDMRYPEPFQALTGPVGSFSGATVCRSVWSALAALTTRPAADLESKLDPFPRRRDCQSPRRGEVHQRDIPTFGARAISAGWSRVAADAATHAAK
jgi:hypothetical protein